MPDTDGITLLKEWSEKASLDSPVIMMSGHSTVETAVEATRLGAWDFLEKPLSTAKLLLTVRHALESAQLQQENQGLRREMPTVNEPAGRSAVMQRLREQVRRIAQHNTAVLVTGESGSGKEVLARYLHANSARRDGPFVRVTVAAGTGAGETAAIDLFGVEDGDQVHFGSLERANGGTLYLEDIAEMDAALQARLVGALQHGSFLRVDGREPVQVDVRIVAATSRDPAAEVQAGRLREDIYYHLNVVPLHVPPLREHREDIPELIDYYVDLLVTREGLPYRRFTVGAQNRLRNHPWPGNVRELKNVVQRLLILGSGDDVTENEIEAALGGAVSRAGETPPVGQLPGFDLPLKEAREVYERAYLEHHIRQAGGNISRVAATSGLERTHLYRKLRALGIDPKQASAGDQ